MKETENEAVAKAMRDLSSVVGPAMESNFHQECITLILGTLFQSGRLDGIKQAAKVLSVEVK